MYVSVKSGAVYEPSYAWTLYIADGNIMDGLELQSPVSKSTGKTLLLKKVRYRILCPRWKQSSHLPQQNMKIQDLA